MKNKTDFVILVKLLRQKLHPELNNLIIQGCSDPFKIFDCMESFCSSILTEHGYTLEELEDLQKRYYMDFSSDNPDEWIIEECPPSEAGIMRKGGIFTPH